MKTTLVATAIALAGGTASVAATPTIAQLGRGHRLLIVSAPPGSIELTAQRQALARWRQQGRERDVATVYLDGTKVEGVGETAVAIRARYAIPQKGFAVALVGKDGHVAYRSSKPVSGVEFEQAIDAMPMRRAGQR